MLLTRIAAPFLPALVANASSATYPAAVPTKTKPSGSGIITLGDSPLSVQQVGLGFKFLFYGTGSAATTLLCRLIGWQQTAVVGGTPLWVPVPLMEVTATLAAIPGVAGSDIPATMNFADTVTLTTGYGSTDPNGTAVTSPTGSVIAHVLAPAQGFNLFQVQVKVGTATDGNVLYAPW